MFVSGKDGLERRKFLRYLCGYSEESKIADVVSFSLKDVKDWTRYFPFHAYLCANVSSLAKTKEIWYNLPRIIEDEWRVDVYVLRPKSMKRPDSNRDPLLLKIKRFYYSCFEHATTGTADKSSIDYHVENDHTFAVIATSSKKKKVKESNSWPWCSCCLCCNISSDSWIQGSKIRFHPLACRCAWFC